MKFTIAKMAVGSDEKSKIPTWVKFVSGGIVGGSSAWISNPTDLIKTRMIA